MINFVKFVDENFGVNVCIDQPELVGIRAYKFAIVEFAFNESTADKQTIDECAISENNTSDLCSTKTHVVKHDVLKEIAAKTKICERHFIGVKYQIAYVFGFGQQKFQLGCRVASSWFAV